LIDFIVCVLPLRREKRSKSSVVHPRTPDPYEEMPKRQFEGYVKAWRRNLHKWDVMDDVGVVNVVASASKMEHSQAKSHSSLNQNFASTTHNKSVSSNPFVSKSTLNTIVQERSSMYETIVAPITAPNFVERPVSGKSQTANNSRPLPQLKSSTNDVPAGELDDFGATNNSFDTPWEEGEGRVQTERGEGVPGYLEGDDDDDDVL
jgi:hypothetical protein